MKRAGRRRVAARVGSKERTPALTLKKSPQIPAEMMVRIRVCEILRCWRTRCRGSGCRGGGAGGQVRRPGCVGGTGVAMC
jgi:hypothetical protein